MLTFLNHLQKRILFSETFAAYSKSDLYYYYYHVRTCVSCKSTAFARNQTLLRYYNTDLYMEKNLNKSQPKKE